MHDRYTERAGEYFIRVYEQYGNKIFQNALLLSRNSAQAKDIRQEVFLKLWLQKDKLETIADMESFLFIITRNLVSDLNRKAQREQINHQELLQHYRQFYPPPEDERYDTKKFEELFRDAITQLPKQQRRIFELLRTENKSRKEVAQVLQLSEHTVKTVMQNAKRNLLHYIQERLGQPVMLQETRKTKGATKVAPHQTNDN